MRPAAGLLVVFDEWEPRLRWMLWFVGAVWALVAGLVVAVVAIVTWAFGGPWWVYVVALVVGVALIAPYVALAFAVRGLVGMWRERVELAARLEREVWGAEGAPPAREHRP